MQYTEENYTELYNNLPKGLRELVLSGELTKLSNTISMKYGLTPEQSSDLEPAIEDVTLGLVTIDELEANIAFQLGLDPVKSKMIAREAIKVILEEYTEELKLTRKYKIELDEKLRLAKGETTEPEEEVDAKDKSVATNILKATYVPENISLQEQLLNTPKAQNNKVSDWYTGGKTKTQMEMDAYTGNIPINNIKVNRNDSPIKDYVVDAPEIKKVDIKVNQPNKPQVKAVVEPDNAWKSIINKNDSVNTNKIETASSIDTVTNVEKSIIQVEQQIFTLTQAINKLLISDTFDKSKNNLKANSNINDLFDKNEVEEINKKIDQINKRLDDMQSKMLQMNMHKNADDIKPVKLNNSKDISLNEIKETDIKEAETNSKNSLSIDDILAGRKSTTNPPISSSTTVGAIEFANDKKINPTQILSDIQNIKESEINLTENKTDAHIPTETANIDAIVNTNARNKSDIQQNILNDLNFIKKDIKSDEKINDLKNEILPQNDSDRMKSLQAKIKSLNSNLIYSQNQTALNINDPYKQAI